MCQNQMGQAVAANSNFRNPGFFANPNVQQQIVTQARGKYFDPNALNAAGNPLPAPASPTPTPSAPSAPTPGATSGPTTATGLPSLASLMQRANVPSGVAAQALNTPMRSGG